jgi:hypothetical protein|tara:strand:+ start:50 stop:541 length:492 start_codon:yes stop_codon:yes gene_type:complete
MAYPNDQSAYLSPVQYGAQNMNQQSPQLYAPPQGGSDFINNYSAPLSAGNPQQTGGNIFGNLYTGIKNAWNSGGTAANGNQTMNSFSQGLNAVTGLTSAWFGLEKLKQSKKSFSESRKQFALNYGAQRQDYNTKLEDRQKARVASNPNHFESVGSYMDKNRIA